MRENFGKLNEVYLQKCLYLRCLLSITTELGTKLMLQHGTFS